MQFTLNMYTLTASKPAQSLHAQKLHCSAGVKHLLMMCGLHRHYAVSPAIFAALVAFQHACRCLPIQPRHTRGYLRFVEIARLGLLLKLANDISNGCGLHFWAIALGMLLLPSCAVVFLMQMGTSHDVNTVNCTAWVDLHC